MSGVPPSWPRGSPDPFVMACGDRARREKWLSIALSFNGHLSRVCGYRGFCRDFEGVPLAGEHDIQRGVDRLRNGVQLVVGPVRAMVEEDQRLDLGLGGQLD